MALKLQGPGMWLGSADGRNPVEQGGLKLQGQGCDLVARVAVRNQVERDRLPRLRIGCEEGRGAAPLSGGRSVLEDPIKV